MEFASSSSDTWRSSLSMTYHMSVVGRAAKNPNNTNQIVLAKTTSLGVMLDITPVTVLSFGWDNAASQWAY